MIRASWRLISATSRSKYSAFRGSARVRTAESDSETADDDASDAEGGRSVPLSVVCVVHVATFSFSRLRSPLSCLAPRTRLASLPDEFRPRYARREFETETRTLLLSLHFSRFIYILPRMPARPQKGSRLTRHDGTQDVDSHGPARGRDRDERVARRRGRVSTHGSAVERCRARLCVHDPAFPHHSRSPRSPSPPETMV
jgi:hypothetical protein